MKPYYQDDAVTIYHGDCLGLADVWVGADVMVTDPPYGIGWNDNGIALAPTMARRAGRYDEQRHPRRRIANDETTETRDAALTLWGDRPAFVFGSLKMPPPAAVRHVAVYVKPADAGGLSGLATMRRDVEAVYVLGDSPAWERKKSERPRESIPQSRRQPSEWRSSVFTSSWARVGSPHGLAAVSGHPHAKPTDVLRELIGLAPGVVADPFMGSGSTLVAAKSLGRRAIGIELEERYCEIAAKRCAQEVLDFGGAA